MSYDLYPSGMYGINIRDLFSTDLASQIENAYSAANDWDADLISDATDDEGSPIWQQRYSKLLSKCSLGDFENYPSDLITKAFNEECKKYIPDFIKLRRLGTFFYRVDSDAAGTHDCEQGDILFGIGLFQFPLERRFRRYKLPESFLAKARMMLWVTGG